MKRINLIIIGVVLFVLIAGAAFTAARLWATFGLRPEEAEGGTHKVQQRVQPVDSLEGLVKDSEVQVWGEQRGDRVVAEVLVFRNPLAWHSAK